MKKEKFISLPEGEIKIISTGQKIVFSKDKLYDAIVSIVKNDNEETHFYRNGKYDGNDIKCSITDYGDLLKYIYKRDRKLIAGIMNIIFWKVQKNPKMDVGEYGQYLAYELRNTGIEICFDEQNERFY